MREENTLMKIVLIIISSNKKYHSLKLLFLSFIKKTCRDLCVEMYSDTTRLNDEYCQSEKQKLKLHYDTKCYYFISNLLNLTILEKSKNLCQFNVRILFLLLSIQIFFKRNNN